MKPEKGRSPFLFTKNPELNGAIGTYVAPLALTALLLDFNGTIKFPMSTELFPGSNQVLFALPFTALFGVSSVNVYDGIANGPKRRR